MKHVVYLAAMYNEFMKDLNNSEGYIERRQRDFLGSPKFSGVSQSFLGAFRRGFLNRIMNR